MADNLNPNKPSSASQKKTILAILRSGVTPTNWELIHMKGGIDARNRIQELREEGFVIESIPFLSKNDEGKTIRQVRYKLISEPK